MSWAGKTKKAARSIAEELGVSEIEVQRAITSFFGIITGYARSLPFDSERRIYSHDKFDEYVNVTNIPFIGRVGPVYSRYLCWRRNEAKTIGQVKRKEFDTDIEKINIEEIAEALLSGKPLPQKEKHKKSEKFNRVWYVGKDKKKSARQVIPKMKKEDVI